MYILRPCMVFVLGVFLFVAVPSQAYDSLTSNRISTLEVKVRNLEQRLERLERVVPAPAGAENKPFSVKYPITVSLLEKRMKKAERYSGDTIDKISFTLQVSNNALKDLRGFSGDVVIKDKTNNAIAAFVLSYDKFLRAGDATTWTGSIPFNKTFDGHRAFLQSDKKDLYVEFKSQKIFYTDGRTDVFGEKK